jgi:hypothetical protein
MAGSCRSHRQICCENTAIEFSHTTGSAWPTGCAGASQLRRGGKVVQETVAQLRELKRVASELLDARDWNAVREGVEAKRYQGPDGNETFVLVQRFRSRSPIREGDADLGCQCGVI